MRLHPDYGGSNELMILLNESYDAALNGISHRKASPSPQKESSGEFYENTFEAVSIDDERISIIVEIFDYANSHPSFKIDFVLSIRDYLYENGFITSGQYNKLVGIYYAFQMHRKKEKKEGFAPFS